MQRNGIRARGKRRFRITTTDSRHGLPIAPNLLDRNFTAAAPNQVWVGDVTYIATDEGWLFLAVVMDLFSRHIVGWSLREQITSEIVIDALRMAWFLRCPDREAGLIFHSDRGSQYASYEFAKLLQKCGITPSMSRKGNCWDNACSETLFGSLKVERLHGQHFETRRQGQDEALDWLHWYNQTRLHSTLNYVSPMQFEQDSASSADASANRRNRQPKQAMEKQESKRALSNFPTATTTTKYIQLWDTDSRGKANRVHPRTGESKNCPRPQPSTLRHPVQTPVPSLSNRDSWQGAVCAVRLGTEAIQGGERLSRASGYRREGNHRRDQYHLG